MYQPGLALLRDISCIGYFQFMLYSLIHNVWSFYNVVTARNPLDLLSAYVQQKI
jgi:hypothetical protein